LKEEKYLHRSLVQEPNESVFELMKKSLRCFNGFEQEQHRLQVVEMPN